MVVNVRAHARRGTRGVRAHVRYGICRRCGEHNVRLSEPGEGGNRRGDLCDVCVSTNPWSVGAVLQRTRKVAL